MKKRKCRKCNKPLSKLRYFTCSSCIPKLSLESEFDHCDTIDFGKELTWKIPNREGTKKCSCCKEDKPKTEFNRQTQLWGCGLRPHCKPCDRAYQRRRAFEAKERLQHAV